MNITELILLLEEMREEIGDVTVEVRNVAGEIDYAYTVGKYLIGSKTCRVVIDA